MFCFCNLGTKATSTEALKAWKDPMFQTLPHVYWLILPNTHLLVSHTPREDNISTYWYGCGNCPKIFAGRLSPFPLFSHYQFELRQLLCLGWTITSSLQYQYQHHLLKHSYDRPRIILGFHLLLELSLSVWISNSLLTSLAAPSFVPLSFPVQFVLYSPATVIQFSLGCSVQIHTILLVCEQTIWTSSYVNHTFPLS